MRSDALRGDFNEGVLAFRQSVAPAPTRAPSPGGSPSARPGAPAPGPNTSAEQIRTALCLNGAAGAEARQRAAAAAQELARRISVAAGGRVDVLIFNRRLEAIAHAPAAVDIDAIPRLGPTPLQQALNAGEPPSEVVQGPAGPQLVAAYPIPARAAGGSVCGLAQLSSSTDQGDQVLSAYRRELTIGGLAVLLATLVIGLLLTGRALSPLHRLTETARTLAGGDLRARSRLAPRGDEVGVLARSFDDMADRIEASFTAQAESEARMRRFIADASHELRTPVTALKGYIDVLRRGVARDPEVLDAALDSMARESERMRILVLDLLTLARVDAHRPQELEPLDLAAVVFGVLDEGGQGLHAALQREQPHDPVTVLADRGSVIAIARNLLVNSCKYAPGAPQTWTVFVRNGVAGFVVADAGPGIAAADLPHVFERFYRGEKTRAREEGGSGLGLSIVLGLARAMGGDVELQSVEGLGTTVTVWLPLVAASAA